MDIGYDAIGMIVAGSVAWATLIWLVRQTSRHVDSLCASAQAVSQDISKMGADVQEFRSENRANLGELGGALRNIREDQIRGKSGDL